MSALELEIITPERVVVNEKVDIVEANGMLGEFGILPGHIQFLTVLEVGEIRFTKGGGDVQHLATAGGIAEVVDDKVTMLVDSAEFPNEIDVERAKAAMEKAQSALRDLAFDNAEYRMFELALLRAITRISVAGKTKLRA